MSMNMLNQDTALALLNSGSGPTDKIAEKLKGTAQAKELRAIEEAAQDFEAVFLAEMIKPMFETVPVDPNFGGGKGEEVFRSFMVQEYGKILAQTGEIGIADQVKQAMIRMQGGEQLPPGTTLANNQPLTPDQKD